MIKAISLSLLLFILAVQNSYSQSKEAAANTSEAAVASQKNHELEKSELTVSAAEQADRDLLIPRKLQEQLAAENATKTIKYGTANTPYHKKPTGKYASRKKYYGKKRSSGRR